MTPENPWTLRIIPLLIATYRCKRSAAIKARMFVATAVLLLILVSSASAKYSGGKGEPNNPYQIATADDLIALGEDPNDYDKHFILTADIDLEPSLPGRKVFDKAVIAPDTGPASGFQGASFTGAVDSNSHTISHLTITGIDYLGLFGSLESGARVENLGVVNGRLFEWQMAMSSNNSTLMEDRAKWIVWAETSTYWDRAN